MNVLKVSLLFIWQLPQTIFSIIVFIFAFIFGEIKKVEICKNKILVSVKSQWGVCLGYVIFLFDRESIKDKESISYKLYPYDKDHEFGHVPFSETFGWLYLIICFFYCILYLKGIKKYMCNKWQRYDWHYYYYKIAWTEKWADKCGNVDRDMWLRTAYPKTLADMNVKLRYPRV